MKTKKIICIILSLLFVVPCICFTSCDSASIGDLDIDNGTSPGNEEQEQDGSKTPFYIAPENFKELAKDDTVYHSGICTGYSIIMKESVKNKSGQAVCINLGEVMLDDLGEIYPVHEDPTCKHDSVRCPTSADTMDKRGVIVDQDSGQPLIFYFGLFVTSAYTEDGTTERSTRVAEVRCYDVETGEFTTIARVPLINVDNALLYKGRLFMCGPSSNNGWGNIVMLDIVTGEFKAIERDSYFNEYNVLGVVNDRLWYIHVSGEKPIDDHDIKENIGTINSCSLDLDDGRVEYELGDLGGDNVYPRFGNNLYMDSYMDGSVIYFPRDFHINVDPTPEPTPEFPDHASHYLKGDLTVFDLYALDVNKLSEGEKLVVRDVYKCAARNGKLYYTLVDYKEVGKIDLMGEVKMFASTDGGTIYEYDAATGETRKVTTDSGYNVYTIYEVTDDGKMFFWGTDYVNFIPADRGSYTWWGGVGNKEYCMLDLSTGEITEIWFNGKS